MITTMYEHQACVHFGVFVHLNEMQSRNSTYLYVTSTFTFNMKCTWTFMGYIQRHTNIQKTCKRNLVETEMTCHHVNNIRHYNGKET